MECLKCHFFGKTKQDFSRHLASRKHLREPPDYACHTCGYVAPNRQSYIRHQEIDCLKTEIEYTCVLCEYSTSCKQNYDIHLRTQLHCKITTPIQVKDFTPEYLLSRYHKSAVKYGLYYMGYRRVSTYSKYIIFQNKLVSIDDYTTAYNELENTLKNEPAYGMKYQRYAYVKNRLSPDLTYPFS